LATIATANITPKNCAIVGSCRRTAMWQAYYNSQNSWQNSTQLPLCQTYNSATSR
jgi:hypothetical protein